jgi:hypothetical protein
MVEWMNSLLTEAEDRVIVVFFLGGGRYRNQRSGSYGVENIREEEARGPQIRNQGARDIREEGNIQGAILYKIRDQGPYS